MPTSSNAINNDKRRVFQTQKQVKSIDHSQAHEENKNFLKIESALPINTRRGLYKRSHSTLNTAKSNDYLSDAVNLYTNADGTLHISRTQKEKEKFPDRISLDRKGLNIVPVIDSETKLRLLSLQHNLIINLDGLSNQEFPCLVFLDVYDNQLEKISCLDKLENLRVLLMGKNRIKKIENLSKTKKLEVLDLHGNQITHVSGLTALSDLKVLNLAGNQIKIIGLSDLQGLISLQELNLRRNRLKKLLGFSEVTNLIKVFFSNNDLQSIEDICNLAKAPTIREITIDNNPISLDNECSSFLISYLPNLTKLNTIQVADQVRKTAMAWRRNKESTSTAFMNLTSDVSLSANREEVISNARINWELLRSQSKCVTKKKNAIGKILKDLKPDSDFNITSLNKPSSSRSKLRNASIKVPLLPDKKIPLARSSSQDTETSQNTTSSNTSSEFFRLPPILVPIIDKMEEAKEGSIKLSGSLSSVGPNIDSSVSSLCSRSNSPFSSSSESSSDSEEEEIVEKEFDVKCVTVEETPALVPIILSEQPKTTNTETASNISCETTNSNNTVPSISETESSKSRSTRNIRSATNSKPVHSRLHIRATTAKPKKQSSPAIPSGGKDREQGDTPLVPILLEGGDYLIEICGRHLNIYGQGALRFIDRNWNSAKAHDVNTVKFNYVNFNTAASGFGRLKIRFPNCEHFIFKETNISCLGQLNALAEIQGLTSIYIDSEGNPIIEKEWRSYAIFRLSHWGLKVINDKEITEEDIKLANEEFQSLSDLVLWSLPDALLQPLLVRLRIDINQSVTEHNAKKWLLSADPALKSVVSKEALQWRKASLAQEDLAMRQKAKQYLSSIMEEMAHSVHKLRLLDQEWPKILHEFVLNTLIDYSQMDIYMKRKLQELNNR